MTQLASCNESEEAETVSGNTVPRAVAASLLLSETKLWTAELANEPLYRQT